MPVRSLEVEVGQQFGRLSAIREVRDAKRRRAVECVCECGRVTVVLLASLVKPDGTRSCGCLNDEQRRSPEHMAALRAGQPKRRETVAALPLDARRAMTAPARAASPIYRRTHGRTEHPLYQTWHHMMRRCYDQGHSHYRWYGGLGVGVCEPWQDAGRFMRWVFANLGWPPPAGADSFCRIDKSRDYEPDNVKWMAPAERRASHRPTIGREMAVAPDPDWCLRHNLSRYDHQANSRCRYAGL